MKLKKIISLGLVATLCLSMFAGCGEKPDQNNGEQGGATPTATPTQDAGNNGEEGNGTAEDVRFVENIYDMGGKTITIHDCWMYNLLIHEPTSWNRWETKAAAVIEQIEKDYNVNIEVVSDIGRLKENVATASAAGEVYANIIVSQATYLDSVAEAQSIMGGAYLADVSTIKNLGIGTNDWVITDYGVDENGRQCGIGFHTEEYSAVSPVLLCFNKDLAEQYEIEDIYELVRNNEWTYDKLEEICLDVTTKSNGAVKGILDPAGQLPLLSLRNNTQFVKEEDGKYVYNGLSEEVISGLEFSQNLVRQGLYDLETFNTPGYTVGDRTNAFGREHKTLFFLCQYDWLVSDIDYRLENYGIVPLPSGPYDNGSTGVLTFSYLFQFIEGDPDIEDAAAVLVAMANRLSCTMDEFFESHYNRGYIRDEESYEFLKAMMENPVYAYDYSMYLPTEVTDAVYNADYTMRQILEQTAQKGQAVVDKILN